MNRKKPIKIAIISRAVFPLHGFGGLERHVYHQIKHLLKQNSGHGCEVVLITMPPGKEYGGGATDLFPPDVKVKFVEAPRLPIPVKKGFIILDRIVNYPRLTRKFAQRLLDTEEPGSIDIVYCHGLTGWGAAKEFKKAKLKIPVVLNPHGMEEFKNIGLLKKIAYFPFRRKMIYAAAFAESVVATDEVMIPQVRKYLKVEKAKIDLLPNAVDTAECRAFLDDKIRRNLIDKYYLGPDTLFMLSVGRLERNKGFHNLIEQLQRIGENLPSSWKTLIVGKGSQDNNLRRMIGNSKLEKNIVLAGGVGDKELHNLYDLADLFILPSLYEGSSISTLEAMTHCCPVIANRIGGLPDKIKEGVNGILCDRDNPDELGDAVLRLSAEGKAGLKKMGNESSEIVAANFSWETVAYKSVTLFHKLMNDKKNAGNR